MDSFSFLRFYPDDLFLGASGPTHPFLLASRIDSVIIFAFNFPSGDRSSNGIGP